MGEFFTAKELKERIEANDSRATAMPYLLLLRDKRPVVVDGDYGGERMYVENLTGDYMTGETRRELEKRLKDHGYDFDDITEHGAITEFYQDYKDETINVFLTDQGYKDHIEANGHNLRKHDTYGIHAFRNKEIKSLYALIDECIAQQKELAQKDAIISELKEKNCFLKSLILLTHPDFSNIQVGELSVNQWSAFVKKFPDEGG